MRLKYRSKPENRARDNESAKRWNRANPERVKEIQRARNLRRYGLTIEQYEDMCERQDWRCLICESDEQDLYVDHDHDTNTVRGLICNSCNRGIGLLKDNPAVLERAAQYVSA